MLTVHENLRTYSAPARYLLKQYDLFYLLHLLFALFQATKSLNGCRMPNVYPYILSYKKTRKIRIYTNY